MALTLTARAAGRGVFAPFALAAWTLLALAALPAAGQSPSATSSLTPATLGHGQVASLTVEVRWSGGGPAPAAPTFTLDNLEIVSGPERVSSSRFAAMGSTRVLAFRWLLKAGEPGRGRVRNIRIRLEGRTLEPPNRSITILAQPVAAVPGARPSLVPPRASSGALSPEAPPQADAEPEEPVGPRERRDVFLRAESRPEQPYLGQQVLFTLYLYYQSDVASIRPVKIPDFHGFWLREVSPATTAGQPITVGGRKYHRTVLLQRVLFPLRTGELELSPTAAEMIVRSGGRGERRLVQSNALTLRVRPLPALQVSEGAPESGGRVGIVGKVEVEARLGSQLLHAGQPGELLVQVRGDGQLHGLELPQPAVPEGVSLSPRGQSSEETMVGGRLRQERTFAFSVLAPAPGTFTLPPVELPYFDPEEGRFRIAASRDLRLEVAPPEARDGKAPSPLDDSAEGQKPASDPPPAGTDLRMPLVLIVGGAGLLALALGLARRHRRRRRGRGQSGAPQAVLLRALEGASELGPKRAAAALEDAFGSFLAERWGLPSPLPAPRWVSAAEGRGIRKGPVAELGRLARDVSFLRQAPQLADTEAVLREALSRSRRLGRRLG